MDLREKLRQLEGVTKVSTSHPQRITDLEVYLPGEEVTNELGSCYLVRASVPLMSSRGETPLSLFRELPPHIWSWIGKDPELADVDLSRACFLDTETTGLAGGTGTLPFLVGLGSVQGDSFLVEQFFMREYREEPALLLEVARRLNECSALVSYNGKGYDLNLLAGRYILQRQEAPRLEQPHLDLLYTVRRLWQRRLGDCSLTNVEKRVLRQHREDDVESYLIPSIYFDFLRTGRSDSLAKVFHHNLQDIVSLLALAGLCGSIYHDPFQRLSHPEDFFSLGHTFERLGCCEEAGGCFVEVLKKEAPEEIIREARAALGFMFKRQQRWHEAVEIWQNMLQLGGYGLMPFEEIAKFYEHRAGDFSAALEVVERALEWHGVREEFRDEPNSSEIKEALQYRKARLLRKLSRENIEG